MDKELRIILNNYLKQILQDTVAKKQLSHKNLAQFIQILYNELLNGFDNKETYALILTILSYLNDFMTSQNIETKDINVNSENEWSQINSKITQQNSKELLKNFLVRRNQENGEKH